MSEYYDEVPRDYSKGNPCSSDDEFVGNGWSVRKSKGKFFFEFISGELAGRMRQVEISEFDFHQVKSGNLNFDDLCIKYSVS